MKRARDPAAASSRSISAARSRGDKLYGRVKQVRKQHPHTGVSRLGCNLRPLGAVEMKRLLPAQRRAVRAVLAGRSVFLTGCGGTGKSHLIRTLQTHLTGVCNVQTHVVATTGIAAVALKGVTVHSFFALGIGNKTVDEYVKRANMFHRLRNKLQSLHVLIIDEVSMLTEHVLTVMDAMLRAARRVNEPMGGVVVVASGDFLQLPVVHRGFDAPPPPVYTTPVWHSVDFDVHVLTRSMRHASDAAWEELLGRLRKGRVTPSDLEALDTRCTCDSDVPVDATWLLPTRAGVEYMNNRAITALEQPVVHLTPVLSAQFTVTCLGTKPEWVDWGRMRDHLPKYMTRAILECDMPGHTKRESLPDGVSSFFPEDFPPAPRNAALAALRNTLQGTNGVKLCVGARVLLTCKLQEVSPQAELVNGSQGTVLGWARYAQPWGAYVHETTQSEEDAARSAAAAGRRAPTAADYTRIAVEPVNSVHGVQHTDMCFSGERVLPLPELPVQSSEKGRVHAQAVLTRPSYVPVLKNAHGVAAYAEKHADDLKALPPAVGGAVNVVQGDAMQDVHTDAAAPCIPRSTPLTARGGSAGGELSARHAACLESSVWVPVVRFDNGVVCPVAPQFFGVDVALPETSDTVAHHVRVGAWCCPLLAAAAITVHKAQGMSMDCVALTLANMHTTGQAYVALSRARTLAGVHISHIDPAAIKTDADTVDMYDTGEMAALTVQDGVSDDDDDDDGAASQAVDASDASDAAAAASSGGGHCGTATTAPAPRAVDLSSFAYLTKK